MLQQYKIQKDKEPASPIKNPRSETEISESE